ncbi:hypothetical protein [Clostridium thailandense]|uniref:Uncharacterized protein n=1 Tax=Clostridium thailandense TaxID=2794346 RepID=A0A949TZZ2_9CLOT|nr:hypothetical protein [Clostridium thailandense]MBV7274780.1 hypothetical protein [Clostridium thailandense]MCH5137241.1 hypothetical protein [Clostridiaceae bacterium UIB06]
MDINIFKIKIGKEEAIRTAKGMRSFFMGLSNKKISEVRIHYVEVKFVTCILTHKPNFLEKYLFRNNKIKKQKILMLVDGTTCETAIVDSKPEIASVKDVDQESIQISSYSDKRMIDSCKRVASRVVRRNLGNLAEIEFEKIENCYRPYWLILYGEMKEGKKVRCIPVSADGCGSYRNF